MGPLYSIAVLISLCAVSCALRELNFRPILGCNGLQGCAVQTASQAFNLSLFFGYWKSHPCVPGSALCAYVCQGFEACTSFNYLSTSGGCELFNLPTFAIAGKPGCYHYEAVGRYPSQNVQYEKLNNLAFRRRTCQSSTVFPSWLAVDGYNGTNINNLECSHTNDNYLGPNWWMVQLDGQTTVDHVDILTRDTIYYFAQRMLNLTIGLTNTSWLNHKPVRGSYPLCGIYDGPPPVATWIAINCTLPKLTTMYVIVQQAILEHYGGYLALCEVEVYGVAV